MAQTYRDTPNRRGLIIGLLVAALVIGAVVYLVAYGGDGGGAGSPAGGYSMIAIGTHAIGRIAGRIGR